MNALEKLPPVSVQLLTSIVEVNAVRNQAAAVQAWLKQAGESLGVQNQAARLRIEAEVRLGELLRDTVTKGGRSRSVSRGGTSNPLPVGITRKQSSRWQTMADVPSEVREAYFEETVAAEKELTSAAVLKLAREIRDFKKKSELRARPADTCTVGDLESLLANGRTFGCIYADPPWRYGNQGTRAATDNHYDTMTVDEIAALPVAKLAGEECHLHLWTTNAFLFECQKLFDAWGFTYKSCMVWVKPELGIGNYWRVSHEFMLLGVKGSTPFLEADERSWIEASRRAGHSVKPHAFRAAVERVSPAPRLELFARESRPGWVSWGNEVSRSLFDRADEKFPPGDASEKSEQLALGTEAA